MEKRNSVFIATSLDGYIADNEGKIDWLQTVYNPEKKDLGYSNFMGNIDALVMGRVTYETVCGFDISWPYTKPVYVLSNSMTSIDPEPEGEVYLVNGSLDRVLQSIHEKGHLRLYIDGGSTIQSFLRQDLIDELIITTIPILLGGGFSLFGDLSNSMKFKLVKSTVLLDQIVQTHYLRKS